MNNVCRNWENVQKATFPIENEYGIPVMLPTAPEDVDVTHWIGFNYANGTDSLLRSHLGVHFFLDDYQFQRCWEVPEQYMAMLRTFGAVMSPDFSIYRELPKAIQIWNMYKNLWLACYWQLNGLTVVPHVMVSNEELWDISFCGYPKKSVIAVSNVGSNYDKEARKAFLRGYEELLKRLEPVKIFFYGTILKECECGLPIVHIEPFSKQMEKRCLQLRRDAQHGRLKIPTETAID